MKRLLLAIGLSTLLLGCATTETTIIPNSDGTYSMEATDHTEADALNGGIAAAGKACKEQGKSLAVISHSTKYTGGKIDHDTKDMVNSVASVASTFIPNIGPTDIMDTRNDFTVTLKYQCK